MCPARPIIVQFQEALLDWGCRAGREYPWRASPDAYSILVAEKLLQQTAVGDPLLRAYRAVLERYGNPAALAGADLQDLQDLIRPLGFTYRAAELIAMATTLV